MNAIFRIYISRNVQHSINILNLFANEVKNTIFPFLLLQKSKKLNKKLQRIKKGLLNSEIIIMQQSGSVQSSKYQQIYNKLSETELNLNQALRQYQNLHNHLAVKAKINYDNNQQLLTVFVKVASHSFKPIELILRFIEDVDILNLASTCKSMYKFIYSPLGYRIMRSLRPVVVKIKKQNEMPVFNKTYLENLCNDVSLVNMDEDDKAAIILTMKTNLMAARQKMRQIEQCNQEWERRKQQIKKEMNRIGFKRDELNKHIEQTIQQKEKLFELLKESSNNISRLKDQQQKMLLERQNRRNDLEVQKNKLIRQKDLLIKKIKAQQKERQEGLIYARQVARITAMLNKLTNKK